MATRTQIGPPPNFRDYLASRTGNYYIRGDRYHGGWYVHRVHPNWEIDFYSTPIRVTTETINAWQQELISQYVDEYTCTLTGI